MSASDFEIRVTVPREHISAAIALAQDELGRFDKYGRLGYGWSFGPYTTGPCFFVRRIKRGLSVTFLPRPEVLDNAARAYDTEDAAQRGEPSPWLHFDCPGETCEDCNAFKAERIGCMKAALLAIREADYGMERAYQTRSRSSLSKAEHGATTHAYDETYRAWTAFIDHILGEGVDG
jgi:hypothetical protein